MKTFVTIMTAIIVAVGISLLMAFPVMWLWNWLMPMLFGLIKLNFWQSFGISLLTKLLFPSSSSNKSS